MGRDILVLNEDNSHFFNSRDAATMTVAGLQAFVDQYAGSTVTHLFLCPNAQRANFRSKTRNAIWDPVNDRAPDKAWPRNARILDAAGIDPYEVWIRRCRQVGIAPWLSMRMNDVHCVDDPDNFMHDRFWRTRPDCWRVPNAADASPWMKRALNYAHPDVYTHQESFLQELLDRYAPDGIELDWMRFGYHLPPGRERELGHVLTRFMQGTRALADACSRRCGHPVRVAARVPALPDAAAGLGMDGVEWARAGLVDVLVPCPFFSSSDFDIPVEQWRDRLGEAGSRVALMPGLEYNSRPWNGWGERHGVANDVAAARGFAASAWARGADGIYLFNWMDCHTRPVSADAYAGLLRDGLGRDVVRRLPRRHLVCYHDTVPADIDNGVQLPVTAADGGRVRVHIGPRPDTGEAVAVFGLTGAEDAPDAEFAVTLNDRPAAAGRLGDDLTGVGGAATRSLRVPCPLAVLRDGYNELTIRQIQGPADARVVWAELAVRPDL